MSFKFPLIIFEQSNSSPLAIPLNMKCPSMGVSPSKRGQNVYLGGKVVSPLSFVKMVNCLYLYSAFLAMMTPQRALKYSSPFTHIHTVHLLTPPFFYEGQFGVQHFAQGHFGMQMGETGIELLTF